MTSNQHETLYPFLYRSTEPSRTNDVLLEQVRRSTLQKAADVIALRRLLLAEYRDQMVDAAAVMAASFGAGNKLLAFGNGGSATDAQDAAVDCMDPPVSDWPALPALALLDASIVTAIANDVGVEHVFSRQMIALGAPCDIALAFTTSGNSPNIRAGLQEARRRGLRTIAMVGDSGGAIESNREAEFCFVARQQHIPRIQEGHATVWHTLLQLTHAHLARSRTVAEA